MTSIGGKGSGMFVSRRSTLTIGIGAFSALQINTRALARGLRNRGLNLSEVIARHTLARGGMQRLDQVRSLLVMPTITEKGSTLEARYLCSDSPAWRIDIYAGTNHVFCEGLDTRGPWLWPGGDATAHDAVPDARKTGIQGIEFNLYGLHRFSSRGHKLQLDGREVVDGTNYYVVRATMRDSYETYLYVSPVTWMIERRRDYRAFHPDVDQTKVFAEKQYSDFRWVAGIKTPFKEQQVNWKTGALVNSTIVNSLFYNPTTEPGELTRTYIPPAKWEKLS
ncbi:hypothetical protein JKL49_12120 [Phenylobacterium sp. 20VBR1]|uniref:Outer membrane lipoprotein-sorting protein n=1 Tax=Phenylobacterium glaciei TaxID=2803784 RepID=A0A941HWS3_9CAUL|nr:hypothetical protein [Phenylobacterium glaciei]MBR7620133.1 hypothetical protein [Phenylobacterium glaciei]